MRRYMAARPLAAAAAPQAQEDPKEGLTAGDPDEAAMKRLLVSRAADTYVVGSTEKLGAVCSYQVVRLSETAGVITDAPAATTSPSASCAPRA